MRVREKRSDEGFLFFNELRWEVRTSKCELKCDTKCELRPAFQSLVAGVAIPSNCNVSSGQATCRMVGFFAPTRKT